MAVEKIDVVAQERGHIGLGEVGGRTDGLRTHGVMDPS